MRIVYLGTPDFAVLPLQRLLQTKHEVVAVFTQPDRPRGRGHKLSPTPVKEVACAANIPVYQPEKINDPEQISILMELKPDLMIAVAFGQLLGKAILAIPPKGIVNVHSSLLPRYRGAAPIHRAIINGDAVTGVTTMRIDAGMDTGDIILSEMTPIGQEEDCGSLHDRLSNMGAELLVKTVDLIEEDKAEYHPQDESLASYAPMLTKSDEEIDWSQPSWAIHNLIRGLNPFPGAYTILKGNRLKVRGSMLQQKKFSSGEPGGKVVALDDGVIRVATGDGDLILTMVQPAGKKVMSAADFIHGHGIGLGDRLGE